jgi:hypothetical protein
MCVTTFAAHWREDNRGRRQGFQKRNEGRRPSSMDVRYTIDGIPHEKTMSESIERKIGQE